MRRSTVPPSAAMSLQSIASFVASRVGRESAAIRALRPLYERLLSVIHGHRGIPRSLNGQTFRIDPHCRAQVTPDYDAPVASFIQSRIRSGAVCVDVGANIGIYALQFARWAGPEGRVIAFEP